MVISIFMLLAIVLTVYAAMMVMEEHNIIESLAVGGASFICGHVILSYVLFLLNVYTPTRLAIVMLLASLVVSSIVCAYKDSIIPKTDFDIKKALIPVILVVFLMPFTIVKNEYYGLGQDQGGYQTQVLMFLSGDTKKYHHFDEYDELKTEEEKENFMSELHDLTGLDGKLDQVDTPNRYVHGIPTYTALLTSYAAVFGYENMQGVMGLSFALLIILTYMTAQNLGLGKRQSFVASFMTGFAPCVIWISKSAFTEGITALIVILFIYLVTSKKDNKIFSIVPVITFACFHLSFFPMAPLFIGVYGFDYFFSRKKEQLYLCTSVPCISLLSYLSMMVIQPTYTKNNYLKLFRKLIGSNVPNLNMAVMLVCLLYLVMILALVIAVRLNKKITFASLTGSKVFMWIIRALFVLPFCKIMFDIFKGGYPGNRALFDEGMSLYIWQYFICAGIILSAIASILVLLKPERLFEDPDKANIAIIFFYGILINSAVLNKTVQSYFYYTRYMVPYVAIAALFVVYVLRDLKKELLISSFVISMCIFIPVNLNLMTNKDDTMVEWSTIKDISDIVKEDDVVLVSDNCERQFWIPIKELTGAKVFPKADDVFEQIDTYKPEDGKIYIISAFPMEEEDFDKSIKLVYHDTFECVSDDHPRYSSVSRLPLEFGTYEDEIYLYDVTGDDHREYPIIEFYGNYEGLAGSEHYYAWTGENKVDLNCMLYKEDYNMFVDLNDIIPFDHLEGESLEIGVYANGVFVDKVTIDEYENNEGFDIMIPKELVLEGENKITFESDIWDASINNPDDDRQLGFAIINVVFDSER